MSETSGSAGVAGHDLHATYTGITSWKLGFWTFIASECLFFGTLISTYMVYKGRAVVGPHPEELFNIAITTISTTILLFSSLAMVLALAAVQSAKKGQAILWLVVVMIMGLSFIGIEAAEYLHFIEEGLTITTNTFGSSYYVLTGTHKAHVAIGVIWMGTLATLIARDRIPPARAEKVEIAGLYWHFVDVIWIVIFTLVYLIR